MYKNFSIGLIFWVLLLLRVSHGWTKGVARMINGEDDLVENVPSMVQIYEDGLFNCGGTLVSNQFVVTAAHCADQVKQASQLVVKAGASTLLESGVTATVSKVFIPPLWNSTTNHMDIAVLKLETPLEGPLIQPAAMCKKEGKHGDVVRAYGWGRIDASIFLNPNKLQSLNLFYVDRQRCKELWSDTVNITDTMICVAAPGKAPCKGDSGGPVFINGKYCGVASFVGYGCSAPGFPIVYTDLTNRRVKAFINKAMKE